MWLFLRRMFRMVYCVLCCSRGLPFLCFRDCKVRMCYFWGCFGMVCCMLYVSVWAPHCFVGDYLSNKDVLWMLLLSPQSNNSVKSSLTTLLTSKISLFFFLWLILTHKTETGIAKGGRFWTWDANSLSCNVCCRVELPITNHYPITDHFFRTSSSVPHFELFKMLWKCYLKL